MNRNVELLNNIYQASQMGVNAIDHLNGKVKDNQFEQLLDAQRAEYTEINRTAMSLINEAGYKEKDLNSFAKISADLNIDMKTMMDNSSSNVAKMMIQGSTMGIVEGTKNLNEYQDASEKAINLQSKLVKTEQSNVEDLKKFL